MACGARILPEASLANRAERVLAEMAARVGVEAALESLRLSQPTRAQVQGPQGSADAMPDGTLLGRLQLGTVGTTAFDVIAYASSGLVVAGLICYPDDGQLHSAVVHVHGGMGGLFDGSDPGILQACFDWANLYQRTAFLPSLRGQDGGEGQLELCLGEADDVAAGTVMLRALEMTEPERVALVGGSMGACVALRASAQIPGLSAVVAYAPPLDWKGFVDFHRNGWAPATETACDGSNMLWNVGGPSYADTIDDIICGHPLCADADYDARSPLPGVPVQTAPTVIAAAGSDNIVPAGQQVLWSALRQNLGHPVQTYVIAKCDPFGTPPPAMDILLYVPDGYHDLSPNVVSTGLLFLMQELDRPNLSVLP